MPTDTEKLAIAGEIAQAAVKKIGTNCVSVGGLIVGFSDRSEQFYVRLNGRFNDVAYGPNLVDVVIEARQKLAAEKESARTPEERRLAAENEKFRIALKTIGQNCGLNACDPTCTNAARIARKALEGGA